MHLQLRRVENNVTEIGEVMAYGYTIFKTTIASVIVIGTMLTISSAAFADGAIKSDVTAENNEFNNSGEIRGTQTVMGGVANMAVAQAVIAPTLTAVSNIELRNNEFNNSGTISGVQTVMGGLGNLNVGQLVIK